MYRSPPQLRSGSKGQPVPLSARDNPAKQRSLSTSSAPDRLSTDMAPPTSSKQLQVIDTSVIMTCVKEQLTSGDTINQLVTKLTVELRSVVEEAVRTALRAVNEEVAKLHTEVTRLTAAMTELDGRLMDKTDDLEQYQRRNNVRIFGIAEKAGEDTDQIVADLCREQLGLSDLTVDALCRTHRVGRPAQPGPDGRKRHRPIIVRFTSYRDRRVVFNAKKKLKGTGITIREDLTARRMQVLRRATEVHGVRSAWTQDGRVMWMDRDGKRGSATRLTDL